MLFSITNKDKSREIFPPLFLYTTFCSTVYAQVPPKKVSKTTNILKKTTVLCPAGSYFLLYMPYTMPDPAANSLYREMGRDGDRLTLYNCLWTLLTNFLIFAMFTVHCVQYTESRSTLHVLHTARAQCAHQ